jgi:hypothetical protein
MVGFFVVMLKSRVFESIGITRRNANSIGECCDTITVPSIIDTGHMRLALRGLKFVPRA